MNIQDLVDEIAAGRPGADRSVKIDYRAAHQPERRLGPAGVGRATRE